MWGEEEGGRPLRTITLQALSNYGGYSPHPVYGASRDGTGRYASWNYTTCFLLGKIIESNQTIRGPALCVCRMPACAIAATSDSLTCNPSKLVPDAIALWHVI